MARPRIVFNHVGLCVADTARSRRFYEGLLGFTYWWELEPPDEGTGQLLQLNAADRLARDVFGSRRSGAGAACLLAPRPARRVGSGHGPGWAHPPVAIGVGPWASYSPQWRVLADRSSRALSTEQSAMVRDPDGQLLELLSDSWLAVCRRAPAAPRMQRSRHDARS